MHEKNNETTKPSTGLLESPVPYKVWGAEEIDSNSLAQMDAICRIAPAVRGALMPDALLGYTMPIGGVLATRNAVIPPAVGVDIALVRGAISTQIRQVSLQSPSPNREFFRTFEVISYAHDTLR